MTETYDEHQARMKSYEYLKSVLATGQELRGMREDDVNGEPGWVVYERTLMWNSVNVLRQQLGKGPAKIEQIMQAEALATGHVDYTHKWALRLSEVVHHEG